MWDWIYQFRLMKEAKKIYDAVIRANVDELPFKGDVFDSVVSLDLFGHVSSEKKEAVVSEITRVLRDDGVSAHYIETKGADPITQLAEKHVDLFDKYFIELDGHFGLETPMEVEHRFIEGFREVRVKPGFPLIAPLGEYSKRFNNEYIRKGFIFRLLVLADIILGGSWLPGTMGEFINLLNDVVLGGFLFVAERIFPLSWSGGVYVYAEGKRR